MFMSEIRFDTIFDEDEEDEELLSPSSEIKNSHGKLNTVSASGSSLICLDDTVALDE